MLTKGKANKVPQIPALQIGRLTNYSKAYLNVVISSLEKVNEALPYSGNFQ
jgi:hypothetical protein